MQIRKRADPRVRRQRRIYRQPKIEHLGHRIVFAVYVVTTTEDVVDESDGVVSLREAVLEANQNADSSDVITFSPDIRGQPIELTIPFLNVDTAETGDLDVTNGEISVVGFDQGSTQIDLSKLGHRAFEVGINATLRLSNLAIHNGTAARGGAILVEGANSHLDLHNVSIQGNHADLDGGGIYVGADASLTFVDGDIIKNTAGRGGGVAVFGTATASGLQIIGNEATDRGGGVFAFGTSSNVQLHSLALVNNKAGGGSAIANDGGSAYIANATFSGNDSNWGGTILNRADGTGTAYLRLLQSTIVGDLSEDVGPVHTAARGTARVRTEIGNTIVNDTQGTASLTTFSESPSVTLDLVSLGHNLFFDDGGGHTADSDLINVDTVTVPLMDSRVRFRGGNVWVHEAFVGSPAIDAGDPDLAINADGSPLAYDERGVGFSRAFGARVDIGAVEYQEFSGEDLTVTSLADVTDPNDGVVTLREALERANAQTGHNVVQFASELFAARPGKIELTNGSLPIREAVTIVGPGSASLVIDGLENTRVIDTWFGDFDVTLRGFTITGGATFADDPESASSDTLASFPNSGPAVRFFSTGTLTLDSVAVENNLTIGASAHGAVSVFSGRLVVRDSIFHENSTTGERAGGGAVYSLGGPVFIERSIFSNNVTRGTNATGGAVFIAADLTISGSQFTNNRTDGNGAHGGGIFAGAALSVMDTVVENNQTFGVFSGGGGIYATGDLLLENSQILGNSTANGQSGGGGVIASSNVDLRNSIIANNRAHLAQFGGGLLVVGTDGGNLLTVENSNLRDNVAPSGEGNDFRFVPRDSESLRVVLENGGSIGLDDADNLRLSQPIVENVKFLLTATRVDSAVVELVIESATPWSNPLNLSDINNNGSVTPLDALIVINEIARRNRNLGRGLTLGAPTLEDWRGLYFDQNQDGRVTALDALRVINEISRANRSASGESIAFSRVLDSNTFQHHGPKNLNPDDDVKASVPSNGLAPSHKLKTTDLVIENYGQRATENEESEPASLSQ